MAPWRMLFAFDINFYLFFIWVNSNNLPSPKVWGITKHIQNFLKITNLLLKYKWHVLFMISKRFFFSMFFICSLSFSCRNKNSSLWTPNQSKRKDKHKPPILRKISTKIYIYIYINWERLPIDRARAYCFACLVQINCNKFYVSLLFSFSYLKWDFVLFSFF